jgi:hypothetical protein
MSQSSSFLFSNLSIRYVKAQKLFENLAKLQQTYSFCSIVVTIQGEEVAYKGNSLFSHICCLTKSSSTSITRSCYCRSHGCDNESNKLLVCRQGGLQTCHSYYCFFLRMVCALSITTQKMSSGSSLGFLGASGCAFELLELVLDGFDK